MYDIDEFIRNCPATVELTNSGYFREIEDYTQDLDEEEVGQLDLLLVESPLADYSNVLAIKLAKSRFALSRIKDNIHLTFLFAVYKETARLSSSEEHPLGEDCLNEKVRQIEWLVSGRPNITWDLIVVDDGCPDGSGIKASEIADKSDHRDQIQVLFLKDAIETKSHLAGNLGSVSESQKGGAILYGLRYASSLKRDNNIILYTDADLSSHLGMSGLLAEAIVCQNRSLAIGSRREKTSFTLRSEFRNYRGKLFIYLRRRLLHPINYISDEQCGFKAFDASFLNEFLDEMIETGFSFDVELLLRTELKSAGSIAQIPIAWMDSDEASTTKDLEPYVPMLNRMVDFYEHYLPPNQEAEEFKSLVRELTDETWDQLIHNIPEVIKTWDPVDDIEFNKVGVDQLRRCAKMI
jgi:glycosyltransferase involved in cell wall biosynthesis